MYYFGRGVRQSYGEAEKWYFKVTEQGYVVTKVHLGDMYYDDKGERQSYEEALKWYYKAAEQGYDVAQSKLDKLYETG